jgi:hypothetical protein
MMFRRHLSRSEGALPLLRESVSPVHPFVAAVAAVRLGFASEDVIRRSAAKVGVALAQPAASIVQRT